MKAPAGSSAPLASDASEDLAVLDHDSIKHPQFRYTAGKQWDTIYGFLPCKSLTFPILALWVSSWNRIGLKDCVLKAVTRLYDYYSFNDGCYTWERCTLRDGVLCVLAGGRGPIVPRSK